MKVRDSGMPDEGIWQTFFDPHSVFAQLELQSIPGDVVEFGCGYGTFTVAADRAASGKVYAIDIEPEMFDRAARACRDAGVHNVLNVAILSETEQACRTHRPQPRCCSTFCTAKSR